jgi:hypothetical protein
MMERDYKIIVGILLATNITCLIIISILCGEINLLQERITETSDMIRVLENKIANIEVTQEESFLNEKETVKGNRYILGGVLTVLGIVIIVYFGGIDPGTLGKALNVSADQSMTDVISQNNMIGENLKACLKGIDFMNQTIVTEIGSKADHICSKLEVITKALIKKDLDLNSIFGNISSDKGNWE